MGFWRELFGFDEPGLSDAPQIRAEENPEAPSRSRPDWKYSVSAGEALGLVAVYRAAQVIATSVMQLSFDAYRDAEELKPKPLVLRRPDVDESLGAFLEKTTLSLVLDGNFFWRVYRDNQGRATGLRVLNPRDVTIKTDSAGNVTGYEYGGKTHTRAEVKHGSVFRVPGDPRGRGPIQAAQAELRGALDARDYSANWFQESGVPTGILSSEHPINADAATELKKQWTDSQGGQRGTAVLGGGWKYHPVYMSPEDAQWVETRQFDTTTVARLFGIPASLMLAAVEGNSMTYTNVAQSWVEFHRFTLIRYINEIEAAFTDVLPRGTEVVANIEALLRPDVISRYEMHTQALDSGWMTADEVRAIEKLAPLPTTEEAPNE